MMGAGKLVLDGTSGNGCTAPWNANFQPAVDGTIDMRVDVLINSTVCEFGGVHASTAAPTLARFYKSGSSAAATHADSTPTVYTQSRGGMATGVRVQYRALLDHGVSNVLQFFKKDPALYPDLSSNSNWTQLGADLTPSGTGSWNTADGTKGMDVGYYSNSGIYALDGYLYRFMWIVDGTVQFDADFTDLTAAEVAAAQFTEDSANALTVSINGSAWTYDYGAADPSLMLLGVG